MSIAVGASVIENTQSAELATAAAGQIARAAAIFNVDEIVVIDDAVDLPREPGAVGAAAAFLARVLQYLETPQYLRRQAQALVTWQFHTASKGFLGVLPCWLDAYKWIRTW